MAESPLDRLRRLDAEEDRERSRASGRTSADAAGGSLRRRGLGAVLLAAVIFLITKGKLVLLIVLLLGIGRAVTTWWKARRGRPTRIVDRLEDLADSRVIEPVEGWQRVASAFAYFLLLAALAILTDVSAGGRPVL